MQWCYLSKNDASCLFTILDPAHDLTTRDISVERTDTFRDLWIILDTRLTFNHHLENILSRGNQLLGWIIRSTQSFHNPMTIKTFYSAYARSVLEHGSIVSDPCTEQWSNRIEAIQRKATRYVERLLPWPQGDVLPSYHSSCLLLGIQTLKKGREIAKYLLISGLFNHHIDAPTLLAKIEFNAPSRNPRTRQLISVPLYRTRFFQSDPMSAMSAINNYDLFDITRTYHRMFLEIDSGHNLRNNHISIYIFYSCAPVLPYRFMYLT